MQDALTHKRQKASLPPVTEVSGLNTMLKKLGLRAQNLQEEIYQILEGDVNFSKAGAVTGHLGGGGSHIERGKGESGGSASVGGGRRARDDAAAAFEVPMPIPSWQCKCS